MGPLGDWLIIVALATLTVLGCWLLIEAVSRVYLRCTRRLAIALSYFFMYLAIAGDRADDEITDGARKVVRR